jgi:hypothetical protein
MRLGTRVVRSFLLYSSEVASVAAKAVSLRLMVRLRNALCLFPGVT